MHPHLRADPKDQGSWGAGGGCQGQDIVPGKPQEGVTVARQTGAGHQTRVIRRPAPVGAGHAARLCEGEQQIAQPRRMDPGLVHRAYGSRPSRG